MRKRTSSKECVVRTIVLIVAMTGVLGLATAWGAEGAPEKWCYLSGNCVTEQSTQQVIKVLQEAKAAGCTHIMFTGSQGHRIPGMGPEFLEHVKRVRAELKKLDLKLVPMSSRGRRRRRMRRLRLTPRRWARQRGIYRRRLR
jgi:hypothetical protein